MANKINESQTRAVAKLARLDLTDDEVAEFSNELSAILEYIEKLNELDTDGVNPTTGAVELFNVMREDKVKRSLSLEEAQQNAPESARGCFTVPKIIE